MPQTALASSSAPSNPSAPTTASIVLNAGQDAAATRFFDFLFEEPIAFGISGTAGTGKTFLMRHLSDTTMKIYEDGCRLMGIKPEFTQVEFCATTNKAADVLSDSLGFEIPTIHRMLGLKVSENYKTGEVNLIKTGAFNVVKQSIVFIDEASMLNTPLLMLLLEARPKCKLVFVGDHAQMAPVGERLSPIYELIEPQNMFTLTEPVRNAGQPALVDLCKQLRETVETGIFRPIEAVPGVIDYLDDAQMQHELDQVFQDRNPSSRVLCYTNARVKQFNQHIREEVRNQPAHFEPGDVVVVAQAIMIGKESIPVEAEVRVVEVGPQSFTQDYAHLGPWAQDMGYRTIVLEYRGSEFGLRYATNNDHYRDIMKELAKKKNWPDYFDLKNRYCDLRDSASSTVYKAQGSTYDSVYVDIGNIGTSYDADQVARMLFVGCSRARHRVCLYGRLPGRYHRSPEA